MDDWSAPPCHKAMGGWNPWRAYDFVGRVRDFGGDILVSVDGRPVEISTRYKPVNAKGEWVMTIECQCACDDCLMRNPDAWRMGPVDRACPMFDCRNGDAKALLQPCPFGGGHVVGFEVNGEYSSYEVFCCEPGCGLSVEGKTLAQAFDQWNSLAVRHADETGAV